jgi:hypothetical protein
MKPMNIVAYGGGTNSTALLIECVNRRIPIELILFADTGGEKPHTYKHLKTFSKWCKANGLPEITTVQQVNQYGTAITLEQICLNKHVLPSLAYGFKTCSQKHKRHPQDKFVNNWPPAKAAWKAGEKVTKLIGFDYGEERRATMTEDKKYLYRYPLIEWEMGREDCIQTIIDAGLPVPGKSSCFFCPASRLDEIKHLKETYPDLWQRALEMEANAELTSVKGLGRRFNWAKIAETRLDDIPLPPEMECGCYDG